MSITSLGIVTSSFGGLENPLDGVALAKEHGFSHVQLTWLNNLLKESRVNGVKNKINALLSEGDLPDITSLCAVHNGRDVADGWDNRWFYNARDHLELAAELGISRVTEHVRPYGSLTDEQKKLFVETLEDITEDASFYSLHKTPTLNGRVSYGLETHTDSMSDIRKFTKRTYTRFCFDPANLASHYARTESSDEVVRSQVKAFYDQLVDGGLVLQIHLKGWNREGGFDVPVQNGLISLDDVGEMLRPKVSEAPVYVEVGGDVSSRAERLKRSLNSLQVFQRTYLNA